MQPVTSVGFQANFSRTRSSITRTGNEGQFSPVESIGSGYGAARLSGGNCGATGLDGELIKIQGVEKVEECSGSVGRHRMPFLR